MAKDKPSELQEFIPTKTVECSFCDILAIVSIVSIVVCFSIAGIIIGSISAKNADTCSRTLPFGDQQTFTIQYNLASLNTIYIEGDIKTTVYYDPSLTDRIEVSVNRTSLLEGTYTKINASLYLDTTNGTNIRVGVTIPSTDFTNCYFAERIIRIPIALSTVALSSSVYVGDVYFGPLPTVSQTTSLSIKTFTLYGGSNSLNITRVNTGQVLVSGRRGKLELSNIFGAAVVISTSGDIYYNTISSAVLVKIYTSLGVLEGSNIKMLTAGNVTLIANKKPQKHSGIKGARFIDVGTVSSDISVSLNSGDFQGELQIQSPSTLDKTVITSPSGYSITEYPSLTSRNFYINIFGADTAESFAPTYAAIVGNSTFASTKLFKLRFKTSGSLKQLAF